MKDRRGPALRFDRQRRWPEWPNGRAWILIFSYVRKRTERIGAEGDDRSGCRRVFMSTFLIDTRSTWPGGGNRARAFFSAANPDRHDAPVGPDVSYLLTIPAISLRSSV